MSGICRRNIRIKRGVKMKYYSLDRILSNHATYNVIFGERSNGKTFSVLKKGIEDYVAGKGTLAIIRRWTEDIIGSRGSAMFSSLSDAGIITKLTGGAWSGVYYYARRWYLCTYDDNGKRINDENPFAYGFSLTDQEHDKSTSYPTVVNVLFDEFLTRKTYLPDEFVIFMNVLSTIIRQRDNVTIFMLGNTVNKYCPYFKEMGLKYAKDMKEGTIDVYRYGESNLTVAVERTMPNKKGKKSDKYFAFDNPKLEMITGGSWELAIYPHCPYKYRPIDVKLIFYIIWDKESMQCNVISLENGESFIFIHEKTTPIKEELCEIVFTPMSNMRVNYFPDILHPTFKVGMKLREYFLKNKVFYSNNECGEVVRNYLKWCSSPHLIAD